MKTIFTINFLNKTIEGYKTSFAKAGKGSGKEYDALMKLLSEHPDYKCVTVEMEQNASKETYNGLNLSFIDRYINAKGDENAKNDFVSVQEYAKATQKSAFPFIKKWFLDRFSVNGKFDMEEAMEIISAFEQKQAEAFGKKEIKADAEMAA